MRQQNLEGRVFDYWTVLKKDLNPKSHKNGVYWICQCRCGKRKSIRASALKNGTSKSCGCRPKNDISGQTFGYLTAIKPTQQRKHESVIWECQCICGNIVYESVQHLKKISKISCGCRPGSKAGYDLTNQHFGRLTVLKYNPEKTKQDKFNRTIWTCVCQCGSYIDVPGTNLNNGHTLSCGCLRSKGEEKIAQILTKNSIRFQRQKVFKTGKYYNTNRSFRFDFYLNDFNIIIEYDGEQHFKEKSSFQWNCKLEQVQQKDKIKTDWCKQNKITLIRIPYTHFSQIVLEDLLNQSKFIV